MNQLSIIYLIMGSVLLVGVMLISISPYQTAIVTQKGDAIVGISYFQPQEASAPGFGKIPLYFTPNTKGQVNEGSKFYTDILPYTPKMTKEGLVFEIIRKAEGENIDTPRPFLPYSY
jgi:hypothetical protein